MQKKRIVVLLGGNSPEREVSLSSGEAVINQLRSDGHEVFPIDPSEYHYSSDLLREIKNTQCDVVFNALHGGDGENGVMQALLQAEGIPFTGSDFKSSVYAMDKQVSKLFALMVGVPVPHFQVFYRSYLDLKLVNPELFHYLQQELKTQSGNLVVKPNDAGSSVGVHIVSNAKEFKTAIKDAFKYSDKIIVEEYIPGQEITVAFLENKALPPVEIKPKKGFYDYKNKYTKGCTEYIVPAPLSKQAANRVQELAYTLWTEMGCSCYGRVDFRYNGKKFYFLEVNTLPGMTDLSLTPMAAKAVGIDFGTFLEKVITEALQTQKTKNN